MNAVFAAEPASIIYIATGFAGICLARLRLRKRPSPSSILMLFCRRSTQRTVARIDLFQSDSRPSTR